MPGDVVIKIENLSFTYSSGERPALSNINLEIRRGEYLGIMGLNGAGKTTLGLSINGIVPQSRQAQRSSGLRLRVAASPDLAHRDSQAQALPLRRR